MINKKGLSGVVVGVLLIFLALTAVVFLSIYILNFVDSPSLSPVLNCIELQRDMPITLVGACHNPLSDEIEVDLGRGVDNYNIEKVNFVIERDDGTFENYYCGGEECSQCRVLGSGENKKYYFDGSGKKVSFVIGECELDEEMIGVC